MDNAHAPQRLNRAELVLLVLAVIACRLLAIAAFPIYDDAFITYRYALNMAAGHGMVYNPGASWEPVLGTTTPGYTVLLAGLAALGAELVTASLCINIACDALSALLIARLLSFELVPATVAVLAFGCIPEIARISVGGMEPPLFALLALLAVVCHAQRWPFLAGLAAALCCTVRPEAVLLVGVLVVHQWRAHARQVRPLALFLAPVLVIGALTAGALWYVFGSPISQSVVAKAHMHTQASLERVVEICASALAPSLPMQLVLVLVLVGLTRAYLRRGQAFPFTLFASAMVLAYVVSQQKTWGWYYYVPLTAWCMWLGLGTDKLVEWIGRERMGLVSERRLRLAPIALSVGSVVAVATYSRLRPDRVTPLVYQRMEAWARDARLEERQVTVLAADIGAIGYYGRTRVLDRLGLVWPEALGFEMLVDPIRDYRPDYVILVAMRQRIGAFIEDELLSKIYRPIRRFNTLGLSEHEDLTPEPRTLPTTWRQDYIVYERISPPVGE
jgi:hypothetical protein